jgi:hypothetical protein
VVGNRGTIGTKRKSIERERERESVGIGIGT